MLVHETKNARAESARINGAKSTGPKSPEGLFRSQTARYKHGLYSTRAFMLPGESVEEFTELQTQLRANVKLLNLSSLAAWILKRLWKC